MEIFPQGVEKISLNNELFPKYYSMGAKKRIPMGQPTEQLFLWAENKALLPKKRLPANPKTIIPGGILDSSQIEQLVGILDNQQLLKVLTEVKKGNFSVRMPIDQVGLSGKICDTLNEIISINEKMMQEFTRAGNTIGKQGKLTQRIEVPAAKGSWAQALIHSML